MRPAAALGLALAVAALAGCSSPSGDTERDAMAADEALDLVVQGPGATVAPPPTDTLYLALPARLNTTNPSNLTILATLAGAFAQSAAWNTTLNGTGVITTARLLLWVDLGNSALQAGVGGDPGCSAALTLTFVANNTTVVQSGGCASLGTGHVPPGEHLLDLATPLTAAGRDGLALASGDQVTVTVTFGFVLPQGVGYVLGGGDHPSSLRLAGLVEPIPETVPGNGTA